MNSKFTTLLKNIKNILSSNKLIVRIIEYSEPTLLCVFDIIVCIPYLVIFKGNLLFEKYSKNFSISNK